VIHDRDRIYWKDLDQAVEAMGVRVLRTPVRAPKGNSLCELTRFPRPPHAAIRFPTIAGSGRSPCWELSRNFPVSLRRGARNSGTGFSVPSVVCAWTLLPVPELPPGDPRALRVSGTLERAAGPLWNSLEKSAA